MTLSEQFLTALYGAELDELSRILLWTAPAKTSFYARIPAEIVRHVERIGQRQNIYFGCGLVPRNMGNYERAKAREIRGIPGVWADIDIINPKAHNKQALPATLEEAAAMADGLPLPPTLIVLSGHGIQPWWLFKEPWLFSGDDGGGAERARAQDVLSGWQTMLKTALAARGWEHDATHDLSRVLRLPGTYNIKDPDDIKPVEVTAWDDSRRYNPDDFEGYLLDGPAVEEWEAGKDMPPPVFTPRPGAPLSQHFVTLLSENSRLSRTWKRTRRDLKDSSHSGYDMSLAGILAGYGDLFSDQDIADVITAHREHWCPAASKELKKAYDREYLSRTIRRARVQHRQEAREDALLNVAVHLPGDEPSAQKDTGHAENRTEKTAKASVRDGDLALSPVDREKKLTAISALLKVKILVVRRYLSEPEYFEICMPQGNARVGDAGKLLMQTEARKSIASASRVVIPFFKKEKWATICQALLDCSEDVEVGEEGTDAGTCKAWLTQYLEENRPSRDVEGACRIRRPFMTETTDHVAQMYIFLESLREWLLARQEHLKGRELAVLLRRYGCKPIRYNVKLKDYDNGKEKDTTRNVYLLP
jgi:putative DNA primase/helicase